MYQSVGWVRIGWCVWFMFLLHTSFFFLPVLCISVEHQAWAALLPLQFNLLFIQPLFASLLACYIIMQSLMTLPLLTAVIILQPTTVKTQWKDDYGNSAMPYWQVLIDLNVYPRHLHLTGRPPRLSAAHQSLLFLWNQPAVSVQRVE